MESDSCSDVECTPDIIQVKEEKRNICSDLDLETNQNISTEAFNVTTNLLPEKSRDRYTKSFEQFMSWCGNKGDSKISENIMLAYFTQKSKQCSPNTLWSIYSMLKSTIHLQLDIDISKYDKLLAFLKHQNVGYKSKKSKTLTHNEVIKFIQEAPDDIFLMKKLVLILGISGACRKDELLQMTIDDIEDKDSVLIVRIPSSQTNQGRVFTVINSTPDVDYLYLYRKYIMLRPKLCASNRLFLKYHNGKCCNQVVGKNTLGKIPKEIAAYLKLPQPSLYTIHCFRRTSAILSGNRGSVVI
uniref:Tyr recombinase domain-containing protein n=1 Tax=Clastoptera arizonana TaxID=38151 RepID=A0A1B6D397_9HEMI